MVWLFIVGGIIAIVSVVLTFVELMPWFKAMQTLNAFTTQNPTGWNCILYPFRFCVLLPKAMPLVLDGSIAVVCGGLGLGGGVMGALIGITIGFTASLLVKVYRHWIAPTVVTGEVKNWKQ